MPKKHMMYRRFLGSRKTTATRGLGGLALVALVCSLQPLHSVRAADNTDPVLGLMLEKGMITEDEAAKVQSQMDSLHTNPAAQFPESKWKISPGIKDIEIYGDLRARFEDRSEEDPAGGKIDLQRYRYSVRVGLRGEAVDDVDYGFRLETSSNPRSPWVTMGTSSSGVPYSGPFGKSSGGVDIGQIYLGWHPESWIDLTVGKMPNPLYTSSMVWSRNISPEGLAEQFKYKVGQVEFFANFSQFLYQDANPLLATPDLGLGVAGAGQDANNLFQVAWQGGLTYQITTNISAKIAATYYQYYGQKQTTAAAAGFPPYFGDVYVGEGSYAGASSANPINGYSGYGTSGGLAGYYSYGYPNNQVGINDLEVVEVPFEFNFKISSLHAQLFGDVAYNLDGAERAEAAAAGYAAYLSQSGQNPSISAFKPQTHDDKAYQIGLALGNKDARGLINGSETGKHAWEVRTYWQHIEQYSLDPNLLDLDVFAGDENLEGIYAEVAYGFTQNFIATFHYGYASRINNLLGTGGTGTDIPQINPITQYSLFQADLTFKF